jgi:hypothetical protein
MKTTFLCALCLLSRLFLSSQTPDWQWVQSGGGNGELGSTPLLPDPDEIYAQAFDHEGNLIVGGAITWDSQFDTLLFPNTYNWNNSNFFLAKYDKCGNVLWVRIGGGDGNDFITGLDVDEHGNIYTQGFLTSSGNPVYIYTPNKDTTFNSPCSRHFMKFDKDGNLLYLNGTAFGQTFLNGYFKRLRNGTFLTVYVGAGAPVNVGSYTIPRNGRSFILLDSLGVVIKGGLVDTIARTGSGLTKFVLDENENIYFSISNITSNPVSILSGVINPAPLSSVYLYKTDTSFQVKDYNLSGYLNTALGYLTYSNGFIYTSDRARNGAIFDTDTNYTTLLNGVYSCYKIDTNLNLVWASHADTQTVDPGSTIVLPTASKDYVYLSAMNSGKVVWGDDSVSTGSGKTPLMIRLRTSDGSVASFEPAISYNPYFKDEFTTLSIDRQGNPHLIGKFSSNLGIPQDTVLANGGASSPDYFILKWGLSCTDTLNSLDKPAAPDNLVASATGAQSIQVIWHNTTPYRQGFNLYRSPDGIGNWALVNSTAHDVYTYTDNSVAANTIYWYKVAAYTTGGESGFSNIDSAQTWATQCSVTVVTAADKTILCGSDSAFICAPTIYISYLWNTGEADQCIYTTQQGSYRVTVTDGNNCTGVSNQVGITAYPAASVSITPSGDTLTASNASAYAWYLNNNPINNAMANTYIATQGGSYTVMITDSNGCTATSTAVIISGIDNLSEEDVVSVYPNPLDLGFWNLEVGSNTIGGTAEIFDAEGRLVFQSKITHPKSKVEGSFSKGVYLLRISSAKSSVVRKLIKL